MAAIFWLLAMQKAQGFGRTPLMTPPALLFPWSENQMD
jgi:hypothetical protein